MKRGLLLFAHGSRDARWAEPFEAIAAQARASEPAWTVQLAFLELMKPNLLDAGAELAAAGCDRVDVVPLFLGAGGHVRGDLPALLARLRAAHPDTNWQLQPAIGERDSVIKAMAAAAVTTTNDGLS